MLVNALPDETTLLEPSKTQTKSTNGGYSQVGEEVGRVVGCDVGREVVGAAEGVIDGELVGLGVDVGDKVGESEMWMQRNSWVIKLSNVANVVS